MLSRRIALLAGLGLVVSPAWAQPSAGNDASREQQRLTSADSYVPLPTLSTGVISNGRARGTLVVDVGVDVPNATLRARAQAMQPRLVDGLRTALSTFAGAYYRQGTAPDVETLGRLMQSAVNRTLGSDGARLLLANVIFQRRQG